MRGQNLTSATQPLAQPPSTRAVQVASRKRHDQGERLPASSPAAQPVVRMHEIDPPFLHSLKDLWSGARVAPPRNHVNVLGDAQALEAAHLRLHEAPKGRS